MFSSPVPGGVWLCRIVGVRSQTVLSREHTTAGVIFMQILISHFYIIISMRCSMIHCYPIHSHMVLCQDLVQVKMSFFHSNLPAIPKLPVDTIFQNHRVTYNRNDYEFVWYYKTFPSIQIPGGMHVCNC